MSLFDIFSTGPAQAAAGAQIAGLGTGYNLASGSIQSAIQQLQQQYGTAGQQLTSNYTAALQPYQQNYAQAQQGVQQLGNVLGLNGPQGSQTALTTLQNTPGYQSQLQNGNAAVNAAAAASGTLGSGNQSIALSQYDQGLASQNYNNYVSQLQPYLSASNSAAGGISSTYQGLGQGLSNISTGLGNQVANQYGDLASLGWQYGTGVGNANANADLSAYNASANMFGALTGLLGGASKAGASSGAGSSLMSSLGSIGSSLGSGLSSLLMLSDERLKEDIEPVGELYDGTNVYRYRYVWDDPDMRRIGVMAQEVEQTNPEAVTEIGGIKAVDYNAATDFASQLGAFFANDNDEAKDSDYTATLSKFLEAA